MNYDYAIPDIYNSEQNKKYFIKTHTIKPNGNISISKILQNFNTDYIYIETNSTQLYFDGYEAILTKIYNKMVKNLTYVNHIFNKSNDEANITIHILNIFRPNTGLVSMLYYSPFECSDPFMNKSNWCEISWIFTDSVTIYYRIYIETTEELYTNNVKIFTKDINFYYYPFRIAKNTYELRIKKIMNKINNKVAYFNTNIILNNINENYKIMRKNIIEVFAHDKYTLHVDLSELSKIYHIKLYYGIYTEIYYELKNELKKLIFL
jgi:hypothetical protein